MGKEAVTIKTRGFDCRVFIKNNLLAEVGRQIRALFSADRALLVSDERVYSLYGEQIAQALSAENMRITAAPIKPGERSKSLTTAGRLYDRCVNAGLERRSPVIALGGGVVGDLAGFVAATYMRGVPLVMLPTTLLAQVDSSVGGKVAVNHRLGKNLIGTIYPPRLVLIDPLVLKTLSARQFKAGLAEVIKYGIIEDGVFFSRLEENMDLLLSLNPAFLSEAIASSIRSKARVVEKDEFETDYRRILNFGHTIGHALEAATSYRYYLHGEAVLIGMLLAVHLAEELNSLDSGSASRIKRLLGRLKMKKAPAGLTAQMVIDKLEHDKKRRADDFIFVLPDRIGSAVMVPLNDKQAIGRVIDAYLRQE